MGDGLKRAFAATKATRKTPADYRAEGRAEAEREIIAWLRNQSDEYSEYDNAADIIERGEHRKKEGT